MIFLVFIRLKIVFCKILEYIFKFLNFEFNILCNMVLVIELIFDCNGVKWFVNWFILIFFWRNFIKCCVIIIVFLFGGIIVDGEFNWFVNIIFFIFLGLIGILIVLIWLFVFISGIGSFFFCLFGLYRLCSFFNCVDWVIFILIIIDLVFKENVKEFLIEVVGIIILFFVIVIVFKIVKFIFRMLVWSNFVVWDKCWFINKKFLLLIFFCIVVLVWKGNFFFKIFVLVNNLFIFDFKEVLV